MSTINDIGIPGVGSGILHPMQKNRWRITMANMGGGVDSQPVSMQAIKVNRPHLKFEKVSLHRYNSVAYIAAKHSWETMNLTVQADVSGTAAKVIQAQLQKQQWLVGAEGQWLAAAGEGSLYKFVVYLDQLDGNDTVIEKWTVEGCWLEDVDWGELAYETGDPVEISLTISFDHARQFIGGYQQGPGIATGGAGKI
ncbi:hypothetical protein M0R04_06990 [Candidatus Dojkabacteria bacterium]|jgi:hypothetical protein|nr:hypothetical protein [Candidatus Dojkabacteria bacterium]